jgi:xanthine/uracil permease
LGGASIVVFGLITVAGAKIWIDNKVDFTKNSTLIIAAVSLIMGAGNFSLHIGPFDLGGIGTATLAAILLNLFLNRTEASETNAVEKPVESLNHVPHV